MEGRLSLNQIRAAWNFLQNETLLKRRQVLLGVCTVLLSTQALLISRLTIAHGVHPPVVSMSISLLFEMAKFGICFTLFFLKNGLHSKVNISWTESRLYCIPALVYLINDNLQFIIFSYEVHTCVISTHTIAVLWKNRQHLKFWET